MIDEKFLLTEKQTLSADFDKTKKSIADTEATLKRHKRTLIRRQSGIETTFK